jgi:hypothetical protein
MPRRDSVVRLLFGRGRVRQGVREPGRRVEESGHEQGGSLPTSGQRPDSSGLRSAGAMRALPAEQRGRGEADEWAVATVSGGGVADKREKERGVGR